MSELESFPGIDHRLSSRENSDEERIEELLSKDLQLLIETRERIKNRLNILAGNFRMSMSELFAAFEKNQLDEELNGLEGMHESKEDWREMIHELSLISEAIKRKKEFEVN